MIVAATAAGAFDVETGDVVLDARDVVLVTGGDEGWWALAEGGRAVLHRPSAAAAWEEEGAVGGEHAATVIMARARGGALLGTEGAHVIHLEDGEQHPRPSFDAVPGRSSWYNPASSGRPDIWSGATDGDAVFVSVHVGGLWRSDDGGETWANVLEPEVDIHQVAAADGLVVVAAQGGFASSRDHGATWAWTTAGLHASYLQSVALSGDAVFVGASSGPFGQDAAVYRAPTAGGTFERRSTGLPETLPAIGPYHLAADGDRLAVVPWSGTTVHLSSDAGATWTKAPELPRVHSLTAI